MRITITRTFIDRTATEPDKAEVAADTTMTVTAERGAELIGLGLATEADAATGKADGGSAKTDTTK